MTRRVDLRSDTVTQPTQAMRDAMADAVVGDDGYGEDPTVNELERRFAALVGKEAAVFVPSGVMAQPDRACAILASPGDLVIAGRHQHLVSFEMGAAARNSSVQFATVDDANGALAIDDVLEIIDVRERPSAPRGAHVRWRTRTCTPGGVPLDVERLRRAPLRRSASVPLHLDGARTLQRGRGDRRERRRLRRDGRRR